MNGLSIGAPFTAATQLLSKGSTYLGRLLTDPSLLTLSEDTFGKAAGYVNKATQAAQNSAFRLLIRKNVAGAYDSKPTGKVLIATLEEGATLLGRFGPQLTRGGFNPAVIGVVCVAGLTVCMMDDTIRQMAMDQMSQIMSFLKNDNGDTVIPESNKGKAIASAVTGAELSMPIATQHNKTAYNRFMI